MKPRAQLCAMITCKRGLSSHLCARPDLLGRMESDCPTTRRRVGNSEVASAKKKKGILTYAHRMISISACAAPEHLAAAVFLWWTSLTAAMASPAVDVQGNWTGAAARKMSRSVCGGSSSCRDSRRVGYRLTHKDSGLPLQ